MHVQHLKQGLPICTCMFTGLSLLLTHKFQLKGINMCIGFLSFNWFAVLWHKSNSCIIILCFMHACLVIKCNVTKNKMFQILSAFISIFFFFWLQFGLWFGLILWVHVGGSKAWKPIFAKLWWQRIYWNPWSAEMHVKSNLFGFFYTVLYMYCISRMKFTSLFLPKTHRCLDHQSRISTICIVYMPYITLKTLSLHLLHVPSTYSLKWPKHLWKYTLGL